MSTNRAVIRRIVHKSEVQGPYISEKLVQLTVRHPNCWGPLGEEPVSQPSVGRNIHTHLYCLLYEEGLPFSQEPRRPVSPITGQEAEIVMLPPCRLKYHSGGFDPRGEACNPHHNQGCDLSYIYRISYFCCWKNIPTPHVICANLPKRKLKYRYGGERHKSCAWFSLAFLFFFIPSVTSLHNIYFGEHTHQWIKIR